MIGSPLSRSRLSTEVPRPSPGRSSWGGSSSEDYQPRRALSYCRQSPSPARPSSKSKSTPQGDHPVPMNLILIKPAECSTDTGAVDLPPDDERTIHILSHLNKTTGDTVSVGFVDSLGGCKGKAVVLQRQNGGVRLVTKLNTLIQCAGLPEITLILAVPFPARLKYLWPVITSFSSVTRVVIVKAKLSNPEFCETKALKREVYEAMIEKGMSQGGRTRPVKVDVCLDESISKSLMERLGLICSTNTNSSNADGVARIFLDCGDEETTPPPARDIVIEKCGNAINTAPSAIMAVGPERGWTEEEAKVFVNECGFSSATLGCSILRVDTAVVAGLGIVSAALDECNNINNKDRDSKRQRQHSPGVEELDDILSRRQHSPRVEEKSDEILNQRQQQRLSGVEELDEILSPRQLLSGAEELDEILS